jgi:hypothetical protein
VEIQIERGIGLCHKSGGSADIDNAGVVCFGQSQFVRSMLIVDEMSLKAANLKVEISCQQFVLILNSRTINDRSYHTHARGCYW